MTPKNTVAAAASSVSPMITRQRGAVDGRVGLL